MRTRNKKEHRTDRRIAKTKQQLTDSLKALIIEKGYEYVTVQDVLSRANVGRSTFYSHYENIGQLLPCEENFYNMLCAPEQPSGINFNALYEHIARNGVLARALLTGKGGEIVLGHLRNVLVLLIGENRGEGLHNKSSMFYLLAEAAAAALVSLLVNWYLQGMRFEVDIMVEKSNGLLEGMVAQG